MLDITLTILSVVSLIFLLVKYPVQMGYFILFLSVVIPIVLVLEYDSSYVLQEALAEFRYLLVR